MCVVEAGCRACVVGRDRGALRWEGRAPAATASWLLVEVGGHLQPRRDLAVEATLHDVVTAPRSQAKPVLLPPDAEWPDGRSGTGSLLGVSRAAGEPADTHRTVARDGTFLSGDVLGASSEVPVIQIHCVSFDGGPGDLARAA